MYCGGINLVPGIISEELFNMIHNYTLEYRSKVLDNGPVSKETTSLASMPFVWILKTMISDYVYNLKGDTDKINGYLDGARAKLVFHSTRGISTLYFLSALGLSDGREPVYANLVNFEIYSSNLPLDESGNIFDGYWFRITEMGQFLPFPGCDEDYKDGKSTLCNLSVFMDRLNELAMPLKEWEHYCRKVTGDYFSTKKVISMGVVDGETGNIEGVNNGQGYNMHQMGLWNFVIGLMCGAIVMWIMDRVKYFKNLFRQDYDTIR